MSHFHAPAELLMDYASGALPEAVALIVATHLALCPPCRAEVSRYEALGGCLMEEVEAVPVSPSCREKLMAKLEGLLPPHESAAAGSSADAVLCRILPAPLRTYVGCGAGAIAWKKAARTVERYDLPSCPHTRAKARLIRVKAGAPIPQHSHTGQEYTLVLQGSFRDHGQLYRRGDLIICDGNVTHAPVAGEAEDCVCLMVTEGPLRLKGVLGRLMQPFVRI